MCVCVYIHIHIYIYIWTLKDNNTNFTINWSILPTAPAYSIKSKRATCASQKNFI